MKGQKRILMMIVTVLLITVMSMVYASALSTSSYKSDGYACTKVYHSGKDDAGFAAFRATLTAEWWKLYAVGAGQGESVSEDLSDSARPAYGWTTFTYEIPKLGKDIEAKTSMYFTNKAIWDTGEWGTYLKNVTEVKVKGKLKETTGYDLTGYVTDTDD